MIRKRYRRSSIAAVTLAILLSATVHAANDFMASTWYVTSIENAAGEYISDIMGNVTDSTPNGETLPMVLPNGMYQVLAPLTTQPAAP